MLVVVVVAVGDSTTRLPAEAAPTKAVRWRLTAPIVVLTFIIASHSIFNVAVGVAVNAAAELLNTRPSAGRGRMNADGHPIVHKAIVITVAIGCGGRLAAVATNKH